MHLLECSTSDAVPVGLSVLDGRNGRARRGTGHRPASLGNPDPLARADIVDLSTRSVDCLPEGSRGVTNGGVLEVGISVKTNEVGRGDDGLVGVVYPGGPLVKVSVREANTGVSTMDSRYQRVQPPAAHP